MGLLERFKALLGVDAPAVQLVFPERPWRQGDTVRGRVVVQARTSDLELLNLHGRVVVHPFPAHAVPPLASWGDSVLRLDRPVAAGHRFEQDLELELMLNTPIPSDELQVLLDVQVEVRGIPPPAVRHPLKILPSVAMQAVIDSLVEGLAMQVEQVGASLESKEFALLYPDCTMVAFELSKETFAGLGPAAKSLEDVFLTNVPGGVKAYLFAPDALERWQRARENAPDFVDRFRLCYQPQIEELCLVVPEEEIFTSDRSVRQEPIVSIFRQALRLVGGGTEKLI